MSLKQALEWRYATKAYNGEKLPQATLDYILDATRLSASSMGLQPFKIIVVNNQEIKAKLVPAAYGQQQIADSSQVVVFAAWSDITEAHVDAFIADIAKKRNLPLTELDGYKLMVMGKITSTPKAELKEWAARQTYLALGTLLAAAAEQQVDATPMEGFTPSAFDEILGLKDKGLESVVIAALGYRSDKDWLAGLPKVRRDKDMMIDFI